MLTKYLKAVVSFKELPSDLQNALTLRGLSCIIIGIFVLSIGICSHSLLIAGVAALTILFLFVYCYVPYFLATRDKIVQISGICVSKDNGGLILKGVHFHYLHIQSDDKAVTVCVAKKIYNRTKTSCPVFIYVLPKNILPKDDGFLINDPLFVLKPEVFDGPAADSDNQDLKN